MNSGPVVSILINNYNYGRFVGKAIESALAQTYEQIEVIVVDDGSTDNSLQVIGHFLGRIHVVAKKNGGQSSALNAGFAASKGDIICLLDADDVFLPEKVSRIVQIFAGQPEIGWCFHALQKIGTASGSSVVPHMLRRPKKFGFLDKRGRTAAGKPPVLPTATSGLSFRREFLKSVLPMPEIIRISSDNYLKFLALALQPGWMSAEELSLRHMHGENASIRQTKHIVGRNRLRYGMSLYNRFPFLQPLARKLFCKGLGALWATGGIDIEDRPRVHSFLQSLPMPARSALVVRAGFHFAKARSFAAPWCAAGYTGRRSSQERERVGC